MMQTASNRIPLRIGNVGHDTFHPRGRRPQQSAEMQPVAKHHTTSVSQDRLDPNSLTAKSESGMTCLQLCQNKILRIPKIIGAKGMEYYGVVLCYVVLRRNRQIKDCSWSVGLTLRYLHRSASWFSWNWKRTTWKVEKLHMETVWNRCVYLLLNYQPVTQSRFPNPFPKADPVSLTLSSASSGASSRRLRQLRTPDIHSRPRKPTTLLQYFTIFYNVFTRCYNV